MSRLFLTKKDIARALQVSISTIDRLIKSGKLKATKFSAAEGRETVRISEADFNAFILASTVTEVITESEAKISEELKDGAQ